MRRDRALKVVLVLLGLLFVAAVYPMVGGVLHPDQSDTGDTMMASIYATLGIGTQHVSNCALGDLAGLGRLALSHAGEKHCLKQTVAAHAVEIIAENIEQLGIRQDGQCG